MTTETVAEEAPAYDPDAPVLPLDTSEPASPEETELREILWSLARINHAKDALDAQRETLLEKGVPLIKALGRPVAILDPTDGKPLIAGYTQTETPKVDPDELLAELIAFHDDEEYARSIWRQCLKDPEVDTKFNGKLQKVRDRHTEERPTVPLSVLEKVLRLKASKAYIALRAPRK